MYGPRFLAMGGTQTVRTRISAADNDDALPGGHDLVRDFVPGVPLILLRQKFHGEINALQIPAWHLQIPRLGGTNR